MTLYAWTTCRSCREKIYWLKNVNTGRLAPINVALAGNGNIEIDLAARTYTVVGKQPGRHLNHFNTCPTRDAWKRHGRSGLRGPKGGSK